MTSARVFDLLRSALFLVQQILADGRSEGCDRSPGIVVGPLEFIVGIIPDAPELLDRRAHPPALRLKHRSPWQCPEATQGLLAVNDVGCRSDIFLGRTRPARVVHQ